ncbi:hypothetical protein D5S17_05620 [Pseudonocardiaceae bacterium YIM PH 21723]|nr:hypothetical protein D5S17_05620 [Pseudonocardiaceae bacterium YIM PH 21723]
MPHSGNPLSAVVALGVTNLPAEHRTRRARAKPLAVGTLHLAGRRDIAEAPCRLGPAIPRLCRLLGLP